MLVSEKHGFVFIHNPKAGGTAIRHTLAKFCEDPTEFWHQGSSYHQDGRVFDLAHVSVKEADEHLLLGQFVNYDDIRHILFVSRDPIERFLSAFDEHRRQHSRYDLDLNDFVLREITPGNIESNWIYAHFRTQVGLTEVPVDLAIDIFDHVVDTVGPPKFHLLRHENLKEDFTNVMGKVFSGIDPTTHSDLQLPTYRVRPDSSNKPKLEDLSPEALQRLRFIYAADFQVFGYTAPCELTLPPEHWARIHAIHTEDLRYWLFESNPDNVELLNPGQSKAYHNLLNKLTPK